MNKNIKVLSILLIGGLSFSSCKKEVSSSNSSSSLEDASTGGIYEEQSKKDVQNTANKMMDRLEGVNELESVNTSLNFLSLFSKNNDSDSNIDPITPMALIKSVADFGTTNSTKNVENTLKRGTSSDNSLSNFNDARGEYVWNGKEFVKSTSKQIIYRFPSKEGRGNDACYSINFEEQKSNSILPEGLSPALVDAKLTVSGKVLMQYTFKSSYDQQGMPTFVQSKLFINPFSFSQTMSATNANLTQDYSFEKSGEVLVGMGMSMKGNFTSNNVKAIIGSENATSDDNLNKSISTIDAHFQLLDLIIKGSLDVAGASKVSNLNNATDDVDKLNSFYKFGLFYTTNGKKIADLQFYKSDNNDPQIRLLFADKSKVDIDTFMKGFKDLTDDFNKRLDKALGKEKKETELP